MIQSFFKFILKENTSNNGGVVVSFGRMNPFTAGHYLLLQEIKNQAKQFKYDYAVFVSQSQDKKKNPLSYKDKIKWIRQLAPEFKANIVEDTTVKNIIDVAAWSYKNKYTKLCVVVGEDRLQEFKTLLNKYNGVEVKNPDKYYKFDNIIIVSAGARDDDNKNDITGVSASRMRKAVQDDNFEDFKFCCPPNININVIKKYFNDIKKAMN